MKIQNVVWGCCSLLQLASHPRMKVSCSWRKWLWGENTPFLKIIVNWEILPKALTVSLPVVKLNQVRTVNASWRLPHSMTTCAHTHGRLHSGTQIHAGTCANLSVHMYMHAHANAHTHRCTCTHAYRYTHTCYTGRHAYWHSRMGTHQYVCRVKCHKHSHTSVYTCTYAHVHMYTHVQVRKYMNTQV